MKVWLVLMILDAGSGEVVHEVVVRDDFASAQACADVRGVDVQRPVAGLLAIYDCREAK